MEGQPPNKSKNPIFALSAIAVLMFGTIVAFASGIFNNSTSQNPTTQNNSSGLETTNKGADQTSGNNGSNQGTQNNGQENPVVIPAPSNKKYKNGTYSTTGNYRSPGGQEQFGLSLTIKSDIITSASFTPEPVSQIGAMKQANFNAGFKEQVVGKNIDSISLTVVNGSSLTTGGFMSALETIKLQAKVS